MTTSGTGDTDGVKLGVGVVLGVIEGVGDATGEKLGEADEVGDGVALAKHAPAVAFHEAHVFEHVHTCELAADVEPEGHGVHTRAAPARPLLQVLAPQTQVDAPAVELEPAGHNAQDVPAATLA